MVAAPLRMRPAFLLAAVLDRPGGYSPGEFLGSHGRADRRLSAAEHPAYRAAEADCRVAERLAS
jgi:hypothetical protein